MTVEAPSETAPSKAEELRTRLRLVDIESAERLIRVQKSLADGNEWVVFAGAGVSVNAGCPDWVSLAEQTAERFAVELGPNGASGADLPTVLMKCKQAAVHQDEFWDFVSSLVCSNQPGQLHRLLVRLPYEVLATTNFDCLFDVARREQFGEDLPVQTYPNIQSTKLSGGVHAYLHGRCFCGPDGTERLQHDGSVLGTDDYDLAYVEGGRLPHAIRSLLLDYPVLFVGTSFSDHDIQRLLTEAGRLEQVLGRAGRPLNRYARFALESGNAGDNDLHSASTSFRVESIRFQNPAHDYAALHEIVDWLGSSAPPRARYGGET